jgi:hypothetical protein
MKRCRLWDSLPAICKEREPFTHWVLFKFFTTKEKVQIKSPSQQSMILSTPANQLWRPTKYSRRICRCHQLGQVCMAAASASIKCKLNRAGNPVQNQPPPAQMCVQNPLRVKRQMMRSPARTYAAPMQVVHQEARQTSCTPGIRQTSWTPGN